MDVIGDLLLELYVWENCGIRHSFLGNRDRAKTRASVRIYGLHLMSDLIALKHRIIKHGNFAGDVCPHAKNMHALFTTNTSGTKTEHKGAVRLHQ